jgi:nucleolin
MADVELKSLPQVFVGNLPLDIDENALNSFVADKVGATLKSIIIAKDKRTGKSRGFGFLNFSSKDEVDAAVSALAGLKIDGKDIKVDVNSPPGDRSKLPGKTVNTEHSMYIGNLDFSVTDSQILEMCNDLLGDGIAKKVRLLTDRDTGCLVSYNCLCFWF